MSPMRSFPLPDAHAGRTGRIVEPFGGKQPTPQSGILWKGEQFGDACKGGDDLGSLLGLASEGVLERLHVPFEQLFGFRFGTLIWNFGHPSG